MLSEHYENPQTRLVNIYNSSGSLLNSSAANQGDANRIHWWPSMDYSNVIAVDSANNFFFIQADEANRDQNYLVKYDSSGNFVNEKKLPPNLMVNGISIRQNSAGEEFIYVAGFERYGAANHHLIPMEFTAIFTNRAILEELAITV